MKHISSTFSTLLALTAATTLLPSVHAQSVTARDDYATVLSTTIVNEISVLNNDTISGDGDLRRSLFVRRVTIQPPSEQGTCAPTEDNSKVNYSPNFNTNTGNLFVGRTTCTYEACIIGTLICDTAVVNIRSIPPPTRSPTRRPTNRPGELFLYCLSCTSRLSC